MPILLTLILLFSVLTNADALEGSQPTAISAVNGDVLYWEGEEVVVTEISGREVRLHVTAETKIEGVAGGRLKTGLSFNSKCNTTSPGGLRCCHVKEILSTHECRRT